MPISLGWLIAAFVISAGVSYYSTKQMQKKAKEAADKARGVLIQRAGVDQQVPVIYGRRRVAGIRVFTESQDVSKGLPNEVLYMILVLCEGEVESIGDVMVNGELFDGSRYDISVGGSPLMDFEFYMGTDDQTADATFVSECQSFDSTFTYSGLAYAAIKVRMPDTGDKNPFSGNIPEFTFLVSGKKVYDPRDASTRWSNNPALCIRDYLTNARYGRGLTASYLNTTDFDDAADFYDGTEDVLSGWTSSVGIPDEKRQSGYGGDSMATFQIKYSGQNVTDSIFPGATITQDGNTFTALAVYYAMDYLGVSNTFITYHYGATAPSPDMNTTGDVAVVATTTPWTCDAVLDTSAKMFDNLSTLLFGCRSSLPFSQGKYSLLPDKVGEPEMTVDESMIIGGISLTLADKSTRLNQIRYKYPDPKNDYETSEGVFPDPASTTYLAWLAEDNNEPLDDEIEVTTAASEWAAENLAKAIVFHSRYNNTIAFTATSELLQMRVGSVFKLNYASYGWEDESEDYGSVADAVDDSDDYGSVADAADTFLDYRFVTEDIEGVEFRVEAISINPDFTCSIAAREHNEGAYEFSASAARANANKTSLPDAFNVTAPTVLTLADDSVLLGDGSLNPVLGISWTASTDRFVRDYEIQWKKDSESNYHSIFTPNVNASIVVEAIDTYDVRVRALNGIGSTSDWITGSQLVDDDTTAPSAPTGVSVTNLVMGSRIAWTNDSAADLDAVEIHVRDTNTTPTDDTYLVHTAKARPSTAGEFVYAVTDLQIGKTNYVFLKSVDYSGNKSSFTSSVTIQATRLSSGYNVDNATQITQTLSGGSLGETLYSVLSGDDGLYVFFAGEGPSPSTANYIQQNKLDTLYDLSSTSSVGSFNHASIGDTRDMAINPAGTKLFAADVDNNKVHEISMSAWDISTASYVDALSLGYSPEGIAFNGDGTEIIISDGSSTITHYDLSTAYDISTASASGDTFSTQAAPDGVQWSEDGLLLIVAEAGNAAFYQCSTAYDITTATFTSQSSGNFQNPLYGTGQKTSTSVTFGDRGFSFDRNGTRCYLGASLSGPSRDQVVCYQTSYG